MSKHIVTATGSPAITPADASGSPRCPVCHKGHLEFQSGDFYTGVVAPDGYRETAEEAFYECDACGERFSDDDYAKMEEADAQSH